MEQWTIATFTKPLARETNQDCTCLALCCPCLCDALNIESVWAQSESVSTRLRSSAAEREMPESDCRPHCFPECLSGLPLSCNSIAPLWFTLVTGFRVEGDQSKCLLASAGSSGVRSCYVKGIILNLECGLYWTQHHTRITYIIMKTPFALSHLFCLIDYEYVLFSRTNLQHTRWLILNYGLLSCFCFLSLLRCWELPLEEEDWLIAWKPRKHGSWYLS